MIEKKISIIVPAYNAERYLERCLTSLLKQDLPSNEYEIIVINDGSTDRTGEILDVYSVRFPNLSYVTVVNGGVSEARNYGCSKSTGKYFLFVDADDWLQTNVLQNIYASLEKDRLDVLVMDYHHFSEDRELPKEFGHVPDCLKPGADVFSGTDFMQKYLPQVVWSNAYRTAFWKEHDFSFLPIRHEDEELIPKIFYYAERVKFLPIAFYYYYKNPYSFMMNYDERACFYMLQAMESLDVFRRECVKSEEVSLFLKNLISRRLLTTLRTGIRWGVSASVQREMLKKMKEKGLTPLPKGKSIMHVFLYNHCPSLFIAYYRMKEKKKTNS